MRRGQYCLAPWGPQVAWSTRLTHNGWFDKARGVARHIWARFGALREFASRRGPLVRLYSLSTGQAIPNEKKFFYQQVLKLGANEASAQGLQNAL